MANGEMNNDPYMIRHKKISDFKGWQFMDSAPKDEEILVGMFDADNKFFVEKTYWVESQDFDGNLVSHWSIQAVSDFEPHLWRKLPEQPVITDVH